MSDIKARHTQNFIDGDLEAWAKLLRETTTWPKWATSYRGLMDASGISRSRIKRMCRDWPHHAAVLDSLIAANRKRWL